MLWSTNTEGEGVLRWRSRDVRWPTGSAESCEGLLSPMMISDPQPVRRCFRGAESSFGGPHPVSVDAATNPGNDDWKQSLTAENHGSRWTSRRWDIGCPALQRPRGSFSSPSLPLPPFAPTSSLPSHHRRAVGVPRSPSQRGPAFPRGCTHQQTRVVRVARKKPDVGLRAAGHEKRHEDFIWRPSGCQEWIPHPHISQGSSGQHFATRFGAVEGHGIIE